MRERYNLRGNWSSQNKNRAATVPGNSIDPGPFNWQAGRLFLDILGEDSLTKRIGGYFTIETSLTRANNSKSKGR